MFSGSIVALVTPMHADGRIDFNAFGELIDWHLDQQTDGFVILGTTGESPTVNANEREQLLKQAVTQVNGRIPVIAGTGTNCTHTTIELTRQAMELGVDGCLLTTPYYNKPPQAGLYLHYKTVAESVPIPQILYNVPGRTGCDLLPETIAQLAKFPNIVAVKEATGKIERTTEILALTDSNIDVLSGEDAATLALMLNGAKGVISVTANVAPKAMHELCAAAKLGNKEVAQTIDQKLQHLHKELFIQANPIPVKWALQKMGKIPGGLRSPLVELDPQYEELVYLALQKVEILV